MRGVYYSEIKSMLKTRDVNLSSIRTLYTQDGISSQALSSQAL